VEFYKGLSSPFKQLEVLPGFYHAIFHESNQALLIDALKRFIRGRFSDPTPAPSLLNADVAGYTRTEYDCLRCQGGPGWALIRRAMKTLGRMSGGISLGWKAGFDSGVMLDYVYENKPQGVTPLGAFIDRNYLESIGWRGIRQRRANLEKMLRSAAGSVRAAGLRLRIMDIASGPGRYVLETMHGMPDVPATALLRDYKPENLDAVRKLAQSLGLADRVEIEAGDAFDRSSLASASPRPTIAIASGIYELFADNGLVLQSLRGIADTLEPGGMLIYTNQPWHPQVEFIARVLTNREGEPWIMRRRTQQEMDELARTAGFEKISQDIDQWGIFTVSLARRLAS
jgi:SAM-dependent methyltransferase